MLHRVVVCFIYVQSGDGWDGQGIGFHPSAKPSGHFYAFLFFSVCLLFPCSHPFSLCFFGYVHHFFHLFSSLLFFSSFSVVIFFFFFCIPLFFLFSISHSIPFFFSLPALNSSVFIVYPFCLPLTTYFSFLASRSHTHTHLH